MGNEFRPTTGEWIVRSVGAHAIQITTKDDARKHHSLVAVIHETAMRKDEPNHKESDAALIMGAKGLLDALVNLLDDMESSDVGDCPVVDGLDPANVKAAHDAVRKATTVSKETADEFHGRRFNNVT